MFLTHKGKATRFEAGDVLTLTYQEIGPPKLSAKRGKGALTWKHSLDAKREIAEFTCVSEGDPKANPLRRRWAGYFFVLTASSNGLAMKIMEDQTKGAVFTAQLCKHGKNTAA